MSGLAHLTDLFERAKSRMLSQYRGLDQYVSDLGVLVAEAQLLEDSLWAFFQQMDLDLAAGLWLDLIGNLLGEKRPTGLGDAIYRDFIKARIMANHSTGTPDELLAIAAQAFNTAFGPIGVGWDILTAEFYPASADFLFFLIALGGPGDIYIPEIVKLFGVAKPVGVKLLVDYRVDAVEDHQFAVDDATTPTGLGLGFDDAASPNQPTAGKLAGSLEAI